MRLLLLVISAWLLLAPIARAQDGPSVARPAALAAAAPAGGAADTAAALHRLFARRRHNGHTGLAVSGTLLAVSGITVAIAVNDNSQQALAPFLVGALAAIISLPILTRDIVLTIAHSPGREQRVLRAWQQHRLPKRWARRALVPEYTQPAK